MIGIPYRDVGNFDEFPRRCVVFSFFKKDGKEGGGRSAGANTLFRTTRLDASRPTTTAKPTAGKPAGRPEGPAEPGNIRPGFAATGNPLRDHDAARSVALATAAKIDAIESEMARDFLRARTTLPPEAPRADPPADAFPPSGGAPPEAQAYAAGLTSDTTQLTVPADPDEELDPDAALMGSVNAIEVGSNSSSLLDEAAILFANGQPDSAERGLHSALASDGLGASTERGWRMLLELQNQRGSRAIFAETAAGFTRQCRMPAPAWFDYAATAAAVPAAEMPPATAPNAADGRETNSAPAPAGALPVVVLPEVIDAGIVKPLEELKSLATSHPRLLLDVGAARSVNMVGAELLLRVFNAFRRAPHELQFAGIDALQAALRRAVEPGRRDPSDAAWMLLMEVQRLQNRQADFEETGIQYCITYEVSPPSWEPPPPNIRLCQRPPSPPPPAATRAAAATTPMPVAPDGALAWRGEILADDDPQLNRLILAARERKSVTVDCSGLRRMAFSSASALLGHLFRLRQGGVAVEFRDVNALVAALWQLLGIPSVAEVGMRRE